MIIIKCGHWAQHVAKSCTTNVLVGKSVFYKLNLRLTSCIITIEFAEMLTANCCARLR